MAQFIEVNDLKKLYGNGRGIRDIHFTMDSGQVLALLGPNGSGKTTIMKTMLGLISKDSGWVKVKGLELNENYEEVVKDIGCIIGRVEAYPYLTAYENLKLKANYLALSNDDIDEVIEFVGLSTNRDELVKVFSTGMKQRLGIANALLGKPKFLILDEPFNGMDIDGKRCIINLLKKMVANNQMTVLISSHMIHEVEEIYTHAAILQDGEIIATRSKEAIKQADMLLEAYYIEQVDYYHVKHENASMEHIKPRRKIG